MHVNRQIKFDNGRRKTQQVTADARKNVTALIEQNPRVENLYMYRLTSENCSMPTFFNPSKLHTRCVVERSAHRSTEMYTCYMSNLATGHGCILTTTLQKMVTVDKIFAYLDTHVVPPKVAFWRRIFIFKSKFSRFFQIKYGE